MEKHRLQRSITLPHLILYGVGSMVGAGIYVVIGIIVGHAQYYTPLSFLIASVVGFLTALSYGELAVLYPYSAGAALYVHHAFKNNYLSKVVGYLVIASAVISCGALARGFAGYAQELIDLNFEFLVVAFIIILGLIACWRIHLSMWIISIISIIEIFGLVFFMNVLLPDFSFSKLLSGLGRFPSSNEWGGILSGAILAFYAFIGFEDMVNVIEEIRGEKTLMKQGIIYAFIIITALYLLISIVAIASVDIQSLAKTKAPFAETLAKYTGIGSKFISLISIIATINGALIQIIISSRIFYGMAKKGISFSVFKKINPITHTPLYAVFFAVLLILGFSLFLKVEQLAKLTSAIVLIIFCLVNLALIILILGKTRKKYIKTVMPLTALMSCLGLLIFQVF